MADLKINSKFANSYIAFGKSGKKLLKDRSQAELRQLAILGLQSKDKTILALFDGELPGLSDLQTAKVQQAVASKVVVKPKEEPK